MKIKVTYEKIFDSDNYFKKDYPFNKEEFERIIYENVTDWIDMSEEEWKLEELKELGNNNKMELRIDNSAKTPRMRNCYEIIITFMFGDGDGAEDVRFTFTDEQYNDPDFRKEVFEFIKHIQSGIKVDNDGRDVIQGVQQAIDFYGLGKDYYETFTPVYKWGEYCEQAGDGCDDVYDAPELNKYFNYSIPTYYDEWFGSYAYLKINHYDEDGDIFNVEIIDNDSK